MQKLKLMVVGLAALTLAACGTSTTDRAISGAGIGAGAGAAGAALTGGDVTRSAIIGAAAGAATGALVDDRYIYLGRPIWR